MFVPREDPDWVRHVTFFRRNDDRQPQPQFGMVNLCRWPNDLQLHANPNGVIMPMDEEPIRIYFVHEVNVDGDVTFTDLVRVIAETAQMANEACIRHCPDNFFHPHMEAARTSFVRHFAITCSPVRGSDIRLDTNDERSVFVSVQS